MRAFERDFPPSSAYRTAGSALVVQASAMTSRLAAACSSLEAASARALNEGARGIADRERVINALHEELAERDEAVAAISRVAAAQRVHVLEEAHAAEAALAKDVATSERAIEELVAQARAQGVVFAEERKRAVAHLSRVALRRLCHREIARGWIAWHDAWRARRQLMRAAASRFRNASLIFALRLWVRSHPPQGEVRRAVGPYKARIAELEEALRRERLAHELARERGEARLRDADSLHDASSEAERRRRADHLLGVAIRRLRSREIARGWSSWAHEFAMRRRNLMRAAARFRQSGLYHALRAWRRAYPPRRWLGSVVFDPADLDQATAELALERGAHARTREAAEARARELEAAVYALESERSGAVEANRMLRKLCAELQRAHADALAASSWIECRHLLYHETLRHVPTAATHGRGGAPAFVPPRTRRVGSSFTSPTASDSALAARLGRRGSCGSGSSSAAGGGASAFRSAAAARAHSRLDVGGGGGGLSSAFAHSGASQVGPLPDGDCGKRMRSYPAHQAAGLEHAPAGATAFNSRMRQEPSLRAVAASWSGSLRDLRAMRHHRG